MNAVLDPAREHVVLINTFQVEPGDAEPLIALLEEATEKAMRHIPGFISANLHISDDRTRVVNYAQWQSREAFEAMQRDPRAGEHMGKAAKLAKSFDPVLYTLRYSEAVSEDA